MSTPQQEKQLYWRCRRGMRELDLMLLPYFENCYKRLSVSQQGDFANLLEQTDQDLYQWLRGDVIPDDPHFALLIKDIREYCSPHLT